MAHKKLYHVACDGISIRISQYLNIYVADDVYYYSFRFYFVALDSDSRFLSAFFL